MKQHILFIVQNHPAPYDKRVWSEALAAKEIGFHVTVISPQSERTNLRHEKIDGIEIYSHPIPIKANGKLGFLLEYLYSLFWESLLSIKIFIKKPFQIIHGANPPDHIFLIALFYRLFGTKYIFDQHDLTPELYLTKFSSRKNIVYKILILFEKLSCKLAHVIICTNESYKRIVMSRHKTHPKRMFTVRNDPHTSECLLPRKDNNKNKEENRRQILLYLGTISAQDGVHILLHALYYLVNHLNERNFICYIIGDGDSFQSVKQINRELHLTHFVHFKGYIFKKEKIKEYLYLSDIGVEPAPDNEINRHSTFIKIMEYMAAGKPFVAFDLVETRYSANNSGILVKPGDIVGFATAIKTLIDKPQFREELGRAGLLRIKKELNWENSSLKLKEAYKSLFV